MHRTLKTLIAVFSLTFAIAASARCEATAKDNWTKVSGPNGVVIVCQPKHKDLAKKLVPEIEKRLATAEKQRKEILGVIKILHEKNDDIIKYVSNELALNSTQLNNISLLKGVLPGVSNYLMNQLPSIKHLKIWDKDAALAAATKGEEIRGWAYDPATKEFSMGIDGITVGLSSDNGNAMMGMFSNGDILQMPKDPDSGKICSLILESKTNSELLKEAISQINIVCEGLDPANASIAIGSTIHELAESMIVMQFNIQYPYRRWFCDGTANYIATKCTEKFFGKAAAKAFMDTFAVEPVENMKDKVDIRYWRALEWDMMSPVPTDPDSENAAYAFVTKEIVDLVKRHGEKTMPAIFKEIAKVEDPREEAIFSAIKTVTGEDFEQVLAKYGASAPKDKFSRLAVGRIAICEKPSDKSKKFHLEDFPDTAQPFTIDVEGKCNILIGCSYATPEPPINTKIEIVDSEGKIVTCEDNIVLKWSYRTFTYLIDPKLKAGHYTLKIYFEGKFYKDFGIDVVEKK